MKRRSLTLAAVAISLAGCRTNDAGSEAKSFEFNFSESSPVPPCASGEAASLMLEEVSPMPAASLPADWPPPVFSAVPVVPNGNNNLRFDVCLDESTGVAQVKLQSILSLGLYGRGVLKPEAGAKIKGLEKVLYEGDYGALDLEIPFVTTKFPVDGPLSDPSPSKAVLRVKGASLDGEQFALATVTDFQAGGGSFNDPSSEEKEVILTEIVLGRLVPGDPELLKLCPNGGLESAFAFTRGTAKFSGTLCEYGGTSGGRPYSYAKIDLVDTNPALPAAVRGVTQSFDAAAIEQIVKQNIPHHNICESTSVTTPTAVYVWRMFSGNGGFEGSCPADTLIPDAPKGNASDFQNEEIVWRVKYGNGAFKQGTGGGHPLQQGGIGI